MVFVYRGKTYSRTLKIFHILLCCSAFLTGTFKNIWNRYDWDREPCPVLGNPHAKPGVIRKGRKDGEEKIFSRKALALSRNRKASLWELYPVSYVHLNLTLC